MWQEHLDMFVFLKSPFIFIPGKEFLYELVQVEFIASTKKNLSFFCLIIYIDLRSR